MEYRIAKGWRIFVVIFSAAFVIGGIFSLLEAFKPASNLPAGLALFMAFFFICLGVLAYLDTMRTLVTIDDQTLSVVRLVNTRSTQLQDIDGYRQGEKDMFYIVLKSGEKPMRIPQYLERRKEVIDWAKQKYEDVDARERKVAIEAVLQDDQYGFTREEREARLKAARKVDIASTVVGFGLFFWSLFYPEPFELMMIVLFVTPWIFVYATWHFKGLLRLNKKKSSPYPSAILVMMLVPVAAGYAMVRSYHLYDFDRHAWSLLIGGALLAAAVFGVACRTAIAASRTKVLTYIFIVVIAGVYSCSLLIFSNCYYDESSPQHYRVDVNRKHKTTGRSTTYYLTLSPWGHYMDEEDVSVSRSFYNRVSEEDSVNIYLRTGKWGVGWFRITR